MSDFRKQVRDHYDAQSLSPEQLEAILARGREAAAGEEKTVEFPAAKRKQSWSRYAMAAAAVIALLLGGTWWMKRVPYSALPPRVIAFFDHPELHEAIQDKQALHAWLVEKGAPADFKIPEKLLTLESAACQVVDVKGRKAYLSCYIREKKADGSPELIHLLVAHSGDFYDRPEVAKADAKITEIDGWSFASWTEGDAIYTLATAAPKEKLMPFIASAGGPNERLRHLSKAGPDLSFKGLALLELRPGGGK